jgi:hypothetical protein
MLKQFQFAADAQRSRVKWQWIEFLPSKIRLYKIHILQETLLSKNIPNVHHKVGYETSIQIAPRQHNFKTNKMNFLVYAYVILNLASLMFFYQAYSLSFK